eukprot:scaffold23069_cov36-Tisochrysis_lutea.AAC.9
MNSVLSGRAAYNSGEVSLLIGRAGPSSFPAKACSRLRSASETGSERRGGLTEGPPPELGARSAPVIWSASRIDSASFEPDVEMTCE